MFLEGYTTILIRKKTRDMLAKRKLYSRESYDGAIERLASLPDPSAPSHAQSKGVEEALERVARFCDGPKTSDKEIEDKMRINDEMEDREARQMYARHLSSPKGRKTGLQKV